MPSDSEKDGPASVVPSDPVLDFERVQDSMASVPSRFNTISQSGRMKIYLNRET